MLSVQEEAYEAETRAGTGLRQLGQLLDCSNVNTGLRQLVPACAGSIVRRYRLIRQAV